MRTLTPPPLDELPGDVIITPDVPVVEAIEQWEEELFRFIPTDSDPISQAHLLGTPEDDQVDSGRVPGIE
ncbi:hypothetical protein B0H14DRAFT_3441852 [Mycena olivaceomarginata]|nr:hypothetical protein B0H14DRAFT_3441852 [Mycena olivaceomarginata]